MRQNLPISEALKQTKVADVNLDVEMETGTGKTYCYIKTIFELNQRYGWSKFIVVVPSIAIREGVAQSLADTAEHFLEQYGKRIRSFIYDSKAAAQPGELQLRRRHQRDGHQRAGFQCAGQGRPPHLRRTRRLPDSASHRRDRAEPAHPHSRRAAEDGRHETVESMKEFNPLFILRYSATHRQEHNKIYRLDALDAFNQKLVKKIAVRGISLKGQAGTNALSLFAVHRSLQRQAARSQSGDGDPPSQCDQARFASSRQG